MKLFEFEAKAILKTYGIPVPQGAIADNIEESEAIARKISKPVVLKSQVTVSGRGKAGGIQFVDRPDEARKVAAELMGKSIKGLTVKRLLVEEKLDIAAQFFASITIDRKAKKYVVLASTKGGIDIEDVARESPQAIARYAIDPDSGFSKQEAASLAERLSDLATTDVDSLAHILSTLYKVCLDYDAELVELNPLVKTASGQFVAADARIIIDDNALFRHPEFEERGEAGTDTPLEAEAKRQNLPYVDLDGDIGIVGNGAGLVMATLDVIAYYGGKAANFLDIGGGARVDVIKRAIILVMSKPTVKAVLINILGGITRCDLVAQGIIEALKEAPAKKPIAVRMIGTNEKAGQEMLRTAGLKSYPNMEEAVKEVLRY
jgi:succinyl-CoA synthetase beta subunit